MDTELEQHFLDKEKYSDKEIEELIEKQYYVYRGYLNDFRQLFHNQIDDVEFETIFEKLMKGFLHYRILDMVNTKRYVQDVWKPYVDKEGNIYPDMEVPQNGTGRTLAWGVSTPETVEFDPKTRLGVGGQVLTQEFDAHSVVQDSLWNVLNEEGFFDVLKSALPE